MQWMLVRRDTPEEKLRFERDVEDLYAKADRAEMLRTEEALDELHYALYYFGEVWLDERPTLEV